MERTRSTCTWIATSTISCAAPGIGLSAAAFAFLALTVNLLSAALALSATAFYVFVYTMWLKRSTPQNIVIGGAAGAFPPMIGWAAVTGSVSAESILLFLIIFMWTPPHFWALALLRTRDYAKAGIPMLPVVAGPDATRLQILIYGLILAPLGMVPGAATRPTRAVNTTRNITRGFISAK